MNLRWVEVIAIGIIVLSGTMAVQVYYNEKTKDCISNPLVYAASAYSENTGYNFMGSGYFITPKGSSPPIYFDSKGIDASELMNKQTIYLNLSNFTLSG